MKAVSIFHRKIYKKESINGKIKTFTKHTCKIFAGIILVGVLLFFQLQFGCFYQFL